MAAGIAGLQEGAALPDPIQADPGGWTQDERDRHGLASLPATPEEQEAALLGSARVRDAIGEERLGAFLAVRRSDAAWASARGLEEILAAHRWRY
jgi:glutamine synthetase